MKGIDFDGLIHNSKPLSFLAFNNAMVDNGLKEVSTKKLEDNFGSRDWYGFFDKMKIPESLWSSWKDIYQEQYDKMPLGEIIPGAKEFIEYALSVDKVVMITNEKTKRVQEFLEEHNIPLMDDVHNVYSCKADVFNDLHIDTYLGDIVADGESCLEAESKPKFIGVADPRFSYNTPQRLYTFKEEHPSEDIVIVKTLAEAKQYLQ